MDNNEDRTKQRGKGRPPAPFKLERLAMATCLVNEGWTFKEASEVGLRFIRYDFELRGYVLDDETNALMPKTKTRRRVALHQIRNELLGPESIGDGPIPLAFRIEKPLKKGRPKKKRTE